MNELIEIGSARRRSFARMAGIAILAAFAAILLFAEFIAPYDPSFQSRRAPNAPAATIRFRDANGQLGLRPFIYRQTLADALERRYEDDPKTAYPLGFFVTGEYYTLLGLLSARTHLFGVNSDTADAPRINLLGTDALGRDRFSRLLFAIKFSLLVCPAGALLAWLIGGTIGLISGYSNRFADSVLMGVADTMLALPALVLILAARAAFPLDLPPWRAAMLLIIVFAVTGWAEIARLTRGLVRALREREFVTSARAIGLSESRILFRHILPNAAPTLITQALLMLPYFLLAEAALSFLGVGLQEPQPSLGNMLAAAADINQLQLHPLLLLTPGVVIFLFVMGIRLLQIRASHHRN